MSGERAKGARTTDSKAKAGEQLAIDFVAERKKRLRYGALPKLAQTVAVAYAKCHDDDSTPARPSPG